MFWFAWTSNPNITWVPQVIAGTPIGMGVLLIFLQGKPFLCIVGRNTDRGKGLNYIIDVYQVNANSAIAANTFIRSLVGAGFPMFAVAM
jgi:DHA1 family multidrug resistance protein-like MFS transporter